MHHSPHARPHRRAVLAAAGATLAEAVAAGDATTLPAAADGLRHAADRIGLGFGTAVNITSLRTDPSYGPAIARECGILVAENEMKMEYVEPERGQATHAGATRDRGVADLARRYLDVVLDEAAVLNVLTWDIVDTNTWLNESDRRRPDGLPQRSLPLDAGYRRKPLWSALQGAFLSAPDHGAARMRARAARRA